MARHELVYCEMAPGDAVFFDGNTLHASAANESVNPRWSLICCYNAARNDPYKDSHHPRYTPLHKVPEGAIKAFGSTAVDANNHSYLDPDREHREAARKDFR
jgi:ectoine hydroxylase-related dioxygenase (phytanoyl-CoA dioxygenase family)